MDAPGREGGQREGRGREGPGMCLDGPRDRVPWQRSSSGPESAGYFVLKVTPICDPAEFSRRSKICSRLTYQFIPIDRKYPPR